MTKIIVDKTNIPYKFEIKIDGEIYDVAIGYNQTHDYFIFTLIKGEVVLMESEKAILNQSLFENVQNAPNGVIAIVGINEDVKEITFDNLNFKTILTVVTE